MTEMREQLVPAKVDRVTLKLALGWGEGVVAGSLGAGCGGGQSRQGDYSKALKHTRLRHVSESASAQLGFRGSEGTCVVVPNFKLERNGS